MKNSILILSMPLSTFHTAPLTLASVRSLPPSYWSEPLWGQMLIEPTSQWGRWSSCRCCLSWGRTPQCWSTQRSTRNLSNSSSIPLVQLSPMYSNYFKEIKKIELHTFLAPWMRKTAKIPSEVKRMIRSNQTMISEMMDMISGHILHIQKVIL